MAVTIRFHGRFVYVRQPGGHLQVIAPTYGGTFNPHDTLMAIPHPQIVFVEDHDLSKRLTTLPPKYRIASHADPKNPQVVVWDLKDLHVAYDLDGPVTFKDNGMKLLDIVELEAKRNPGGTLKLDSPALMASDTRTNSVIRVAAGRGTFTGGNPGVQFVSAQAVTALAAGGGPLKVANEPGTTTAVSATPAELISFAVKLKPSTSTPTLTLRFSNAAGKEVGRVTVVDKAVISLSNLCAPIENPRNSDLEFARYYDLLKPSPGSAGLVPHNGTGGAEAACCVCAAQVPESAL